MSTPVSTPAQATQPVATTPTPDVKALASPESKSKAVAHVTELFKKLQPITGQSGYNVFIKLTPALTKLAAADCTVEEVNAAMKLDENKETYAVVKPQPVANSASPMVQAAVEGAGPVAPFASKLG